MFSSASELFSRKMDVRINDVLAQVYMNLSVSSCLEMIRQLLKSNLGIGKLTNWDFWVKNL